MTRVIDAHHHLIDPTRVVYPWMTPALDALRRPFTMADLVPELEAAGVTGTVLVQARAHLDETLEHLAVAAGSPTVLGVVGWVDLTDPGLDEVLARLRSVPGGERLVGIRHPVHDEADPAWLGRPDVRRGIAAVGRAGLAFDLLIRPRETPAALAAVRAEPGTRFVVDHLAKPPIASGAREPWAGLLDELASLPNTACKLSGLVTEAAWGSWTVDDLRPYVDHAIERFGPDRLLFGSDWPVCLVAAPYPTVFATALAVLDGLTGPERAEVFGGTAGRAYRLGT